MLGALLLTGSGGQQSWSGTPPAASGSPRVAVLTLNWNGRRWLGDCLASLARLDYPNFELVVIDNGSTDGSQAYVRQYFPGVHLVENGANLGYARGFNAGLRYAADRGAEFFLVVNNDTVIDSGALTALVETALSQPRAGFVTGKVYFYNRPDVLQTVGKREHPIYWNGPHIGAGERDEGQHDAVAERIFVDDTYALINRQVYEEVGGYDGRLFIQCEEFDWQARAKRRRWRCYYAPAARLWHHGSLSMGGIGSPTSEYFLVRNMVYVMAQHVGGRRFMRFYAAVASHRLISLAKGIIGRRPNLNVRLAAVLGLADGTLWLVHRRPNTGVPAYIKRLQSSVP